MDANEYREICCRPDSFQRAVLEATTQILLQSHPPLAVRVRELLEGSPISKPDLHGAGKNTDYFTVKLDVADAEQIVGFLQDAEVAAVLDAQMAPVESNGRTPTKADRVAALVDTWMGYVAFREEAAI